MKIFNKFMSGISHAFKKVTNYELDKKVVIVSNQYIITLDKPFLNSQILETLLNGKVFKCQISQKLYII